MKNLKLLRTNAAELKTKVLVLVTILCLSGGACQKSDGLELPVEVRYENWKRKVKGIPLDQYLNAEKIDSFRYVPYNNRPMSVFYPCDLDLKDEASQFALNDSIVVRMLCLESDTACLLEYKYNVFKLQNRGVLFQHTEGYIKERTAITYSVNNPEVINHYMPIKRYCFSTYGKRHYIEYHENRNDPDTWDFNLYQVGIVLSIYPLQEY